MTDDAVRTVSEQPEIVCLLVLGDVLIGVTKQHNERAWLYDVLCGVYLHYVPDLAGAIERCSWHLDLAVELLHGYQLYDNLPVHVHDLAGAVEQGFLHLDLAVESYFARCMSLSNLDHLRVKAFAKREENELNQSTKSTKSDSAYKVVPT